MLTLQSFTTDYATRRYSEARRSSINIKMYLPVVIGGKPGTVFTKTKFEIRILLVMTVDLFLSE